MSGCIVHFVTLDIPGNSYITSTKVCSKIDRNPRAPVPLVIASSAVADIALSVKIKSTLSILNNSWYCLIREFFGSVKTFARASLSKWSNETFIGKRPINSGINPYFWRSTGEIYRKIF